MTNSTLHIIFHVINEKILPAYSFIRMCLFIKQVRVENSKNQVQIDTGDCLKANSTVPNISVKPTLMISSYSV